MTPTAGTARATRMPPITVRLPVTTTSAVRPNWLRRFSMAIRTVVRTPKTSCSSRTRVTVLHSATAPSLKPGASTLRTNHGVAAMQIATITSTTALIRVATRLASSASAAAPSRCATPTSTAKISGDMG